jgi:hypothetical protein
MYGYGGFVARIAQLDELMRGVDPTWQSSSYAAGLVGAGGLVGSAGDALSDTSPFAGVLESVSADSSVSSDTVAAAAGPYANTVYAGIRVTDESEIGFGNPMPSGRLTQAFGPTSLAMEPPATVDGVHYAHYHSGIDLASKRGTPILAAANGTVTYAGRESDGAVVVKIRHDDGYVTLYGHLNPDLDVKVGDVVSRGQEIGTEGDTGKSTGPHLHFALYNPSGKAIDPTPYLKSGRLPDAVSTKSPAAVSLPSSLASPSSVSDTGSTSWEPTQTVLARFDAVASHIPYASQIRAAAVANGIDPLLLAALVSKESSFHATSVSSCGAKGLTQLMPATASGMGVKNVFDPQQNLDGGAKYLALQLKRFGRIDKALAAYNKGPGTVWRAGTVPESARGYVSHVLAKWTHYEEAAS